MEEESINIKKVIILVGAYCAYMLGSGFSTGQEVLQFFTSSGATKGIISSIIFMAFMMIFCYALYGVGQKMQFEDPYDVFEYYCGKYIGKIYTWYSVVLLYGIYVTMLAGGGATIHQYYGAPTSIATCIMALVSLATAILGVEKLIDIIGVIGPIKILFMIIIGVAAFITLAGNPNLYSGNSAFILTTASGVKTASGNWLWSGVLYAFLGLMFGVSFYVINGQSAGSVKEARLSGMIGTVFYTLAIILLIVAETVYFDVVKGQQVPTLAIAKRITPILGLIFLIIIVLCIYSALSSMILVITRKFAVDKTKKFNFVALGLTLIGMLVGSVLPFDKLVNILYPISGYSGIVFFLFIIYKEFINNNAFPYRKNDKKIVENNGKTI
ncbi:hypothetical protein D4Z93_08340 [Clostridium fermenticellae]|uniref:Amino acid permease n=1 Tax=Clostridium fermenticellae TaxID=2068654 RepID=A0A386H4V7_9CLOT|nr:hypothetical protein [Clostridium fermenticellae]AYD40535.1 hypothetical protein D4Z93_08340 [Clostridium fermenticellae]